MPTETEPEKINRYLQRIDRLFAREARSPSPALSARSHYKTPNNAKFRFEKDSKSFIKTISTVFSSHLRQCFTLIVLNTHLKTESRQRVKLPDKKNRQSELASNDVKLKEQSRKEVSKKVISRLIFEPNGSVSVDLTLAAKLIVPLLKKLLNRLLVSQAFNKLRERVAFDNSQSERSTSFALSTPMTAQMSSRQYVRNPYRSEYGKQGLRTIDTVSMRLSPVFAGAFATQNRVSRSPAQMYTPKEGTKMQLPTTTLQNSSQDMQVNSNGARSEVGTIDSVAKQMKDLTRGDRNQIGYSQINRYPYNSTVFRVLATQHHSSSKPPTFIEARMLVLNLKKCLDRVMSQTYYQLVLFATTHHHKINLKTTSKATEADRLSANTVKKKILFEPEETGNYRIVPSKIDVKAEGLTINTNKIVCQLIEKYYSFLKQKNIDLFNVIGRHRLALGNVQSRVYSRYRYQLACQKAMTPFILSTSSLIRKRQHQFWNKISSRKASTTKRENLNFHRLNQGFLILCKLQIEFSLRSKLKTLSCLKICQHKEHCQAFPSFSLSAQQPHANSAPLLKCLSNIQTQYLLLRVEFIARLKCLHRKNKPILTFVPSEKNLGLRSRAQTPKFAL